MASPPLIVLIAAVLAGCAYSPELTLLVGPKRIENNTEAGMTLAVVQRFGENGHSVCGVIHSSDPEHGEPFNNLPEFVLDTAGCGVRVGGRR